MHQLQVAGGELVEPHIARLVDAVDFADMLGTVVLGVLQILQHRAGGHDAHRQVLYAEALQRGRAELFQQQLVGIVRGEHPVVEGVGIVLLGEMILEPVQLASLQHHLGGVEVLHQFVDIGQVALGHVELARGDVEERDAVHLVRQVEAAEEVVLLHLQRRVGVGDARRHQLGDAAFHEALHGLGVFQLLADGHAQPCPHKPREVLVDGMVGNACQVGVSATPAGLARQRQTEDGRGATGIFAEGLVEVAHAEQQHRVGVPPLQFGMLPHQRRVVLSSLSHSLFFCPNGCDVFLLHGAGNFSPEGPPPVVWRVSSCSPAQ